MAEQAIRWKDSRGILHETEEAADQATAQHFHGEIRAAAVMQFLSLLGETQPMSGSGPTAPFPTRMDVAHWLAENWPAIKAIGFAYRLDDLAPPAKGE